jgi:predicted metal-dependent hydrolase
MESDGDVTARMPPRFDDGVALFNDGQFFEAHEAFEELLDDVEEDERWDLLVALIQVAVGYHKLASGHPGSARMLELGLTKLGAFADRACGVDVAALRRRVAADVAAVSASGEAASRLVANPPRIELATQA